MAIMQSRRRSVANAGNRECSLPGTSPEPTGTMPNIGRGRIPLPR